MEELRCFADYKSRPHTSVLEFGNISVSEVVSQYSGYLSNLSGPKMAKPEPLAIDFYLHNAAVASVAQLVEQTQPLTESQQKILNSYYEVMEAHGLRAFFYLFLICTREARHWHMSPSYKSKLEAKYGTSLGFFGNIPDSSGEILSYLMNHPPEFTMRCFTNLLYDIFETGDFGSSYGGKKWANVTLPLRDFVNGKISLELMLDVVWTLAHNTAPIFNKGMLFSQADKSELEKILDVQRAGMIPSLVAHMESSYVTVAQKTFVAEVRQVIPDFGMAEVDWHKVQNLGAVGNYVAKPKIKPKSMSTPPVSNIKTPDNDPSLLQINMTEWVNKISRKEVHA